MEQIHGPFKSKNRDGIPQGLCSEVREKEERNGIGFTGLVYDVDHKKLHAVYEDHLTGRIRIECTCEESGQEVSTSISAA